MLAKFHNCTLRLSDYETQRTDIMKTHSFPNNTSPINNPALIMLHMPHKYKRGRVHDISDRDCCCYKRQTVTYVFLDYQTAVVGSPMVRCSTLVYYCHVFYAK